MSELLQGEPRIEMRAGVPVVTRAPRTALISLDAIQRADPQVIAVTGNKITLAGQVLYRVTGWDAHGSALVCELVEDRRPPR